MLDGSLNCGLFITTGHAHTPALDREFQIRQSKRWNSKSSDIASRSIIAS
jgi:hypothetical protein